MKDALPPKNPIRVIQKLKLLIKVFEIKNLRRRLRWELMSMHQQVDSLQ